MSDPAPPAHRDRERFLKRLPTHLDLIRKVRSELETDPANAAEALRRFATFVADEAARLEFGEIEGVARVLAEGTSSEAAALSTTLSQIDRLESLMVELVPPEELVQILIVEDEATSVLLAKRALEGEGRAVRVVQTAAAARAGLHEQPPDLVVLDLILPDADGRHLLMEISRDLGSARPSVVVVTASGTPTTRAECFAYGASAFLEKPLDPETLRRVASDVLNRSRAKANKADRVAELPDRVQVRDAFLHIQARREESGDPLVLALVETDPSGLGWDQEGRVPRELRDLHGRVAATVQEGLSPGDTVGRWGVSELVVLFSGREPEACVRVLERAQERIEAGARSFVAGVTEVAENALFEDAVSWASRLVSEARMTADAGILHTTLAKTRAPFVLVVEDDPITASLLMHRFSRSGFEVEHHDNGLRGLEAIRRTLPDLVILDIRLPGMDGFEILSRMNDEGVTQDVRTIVLTGLGRESDVARAFALGADDYLVKPFSPVELTARALRLVRR